MKEKYSTKLWGRLVKERDGERCQHEGCGATEMLEAHHIIPVSLGGGNTLNNGITLCREHHMRDNTREHNRSRTAAKSQRLFARRKGGKREAAYRFLSRKRLIERASPHGPWRSDRDD